MKRINKDKTFGFGATIPDLGQAISEYKLAHADTNDNHFGSINFYLYVWCIAFIIKIPNMTWKGRGKFWTRFSNEPDGEDRGQSVNQNICIADENPISNTKLILLLLQWIILTVQNIKTTRQKAWMNELDIGTCVYSFFLCLYIFCF